MLDLIQRNTPQLSELVDIEYIGKENGHSVYEIEAVNGRLVLRGDCNISLAAAYYRYLKLYFNVNLSHCGNSKIDIRFKKLPLPSEKIRNVIIQDKRAYLSYPALSYSTCWWTWEQWEREIDFMAMNGINMPLSVVGSECVWYHTLRDIGLSAPYALDCLSGPAFWSWQATGNIHNYFPLVDPLYIKNRRELAKKIIDREKELGMTPVVQGFWGCIPKKLMGLIKGAKAVLMPPWCGFPPVVMLDPDCPAFAQLNEALIKKQSELFGENHYYAVNPMYEYDDADGKYSALLGKLSEEVLEIYLKYDPEAKIVINHAGAHKSFIEKIPHEHLLIFDTDGNGHKETDGYNGAPFVVGTLHNRGGRTALFGDINAVAENPYLEISKKYPNAEGVGLFTESLDQNPLYYDLVLDTMTRGEKIDVDAWLRNYALRRYGSDEECLFNAVKALHDSCYSDKNPGRETSSIICARPSTEMPHTAPYDEIELFYNNRTLLSAAEDLLRAENAHNDAYKYDLCDIVRQILSNLAKEYYKQSLKGCREKDVRIFERYSNAFLTLLEDMDKLLKTVDIFTLSYRMSMADHCAKLDADKMNFEINQLMQVTLWGPIGEYTLYDYAWREWGDMVGTYYLKRWRVFYELLASHFKDKKPIDLVTRKQIAGRNEYRGNKVYKRYEKLDNYWIAHYRPSEDNEADTADEARELVRKYKNDILELFPEN
ncbi:MAG: alpha-N-acetylglucosaminidase [Clostridiales bacterium]|nr:alpha-N-acetylglucosaminidase [Clostridiales bacterium]